MPGLEKPTLNPSRSADAFAGRPMPGLGKPTLNPSRSADAFDGRPMPGLGKPTLNLWRSADAFDGRSMPGPWGTPRSICSGRPMRSLAGRCRASGPAFNV